MPTRFLTLANLIEYGMLPRFGSMEGFVHIEVSVVVSMPMGITTGNRPIASVAPGSVAEAAGIKPYDVIVRVNGTATAPTSPLSRLTSTRS